MQGGHKHRAHSPSCTSQCGPVQPSSQKQEPEPPRPSSQWPWEVQLQAGERDRQDGGGTWAMWIREQDRAGSGRTAYLGKGAQRRLGHRVHMPSRQTSNGTYTSRCRSCRPYTYRGHYRGCWHPQGKLGVRVGEERWGQGCSSGAADTHPQPSHTVHPPPSSSRGSCRSSNPPSCPRPGEHPDPQHTPPGPVPSTHPPQLLEHSHLVRSTPRPQPLTTLTPFLRHNGQNYALGHLGSWRSQPQDTHLGTHCHSDQGSSWASRWW